MENVTRRGFSGLMGAAIAGSMAGLGRSFASAGEGGDGAVAGGLLTGSVQGDELPVWPLANPDLTDDEAMAWLLDEPMVTEDYVQPDGTVVPAIYLRLRNRINRIGQGIGSDLSGQGNWDFWMNLFSEEDAGHYMEMPMFQLFAAHDYAAVSGRTEEECSRICEDMSRRGLLNRMRRAGVAYYHVLTFAHGIFEFNLDKYEQPGFLDGMPGVSGADKVSQKNDMGTPIYHALPVSRDVLKDGEELLPYNDYEAVIKRNETLAVSPCQCRLSAIVLTGNEGISELWPMRTCISTGEQAEFYIENGIGEPISQEEALSILHDAVERGMVVEAMYTKQSDVLCCCHSKACCGPLGGVVAANGLGDCMAKFSPYMVEHDREACIQCGACVDRCPVDAVSMAEEDGYPVVDRKCVGCGQCALICPTAARALVLKDDDIDRSLPDTMLDDYVAKSLARVKKGHIWDFVG